MSSLGTFDFCKGSVEQLGSFFVTTERLRITPVTLLEVDDIFHEFTEEIGKFMIPAPPRSRSESEAFIAQTTQRRDQGSELVVVAREVKSGEFVGLLGLHALSTPRVVEVGLWLKASMHGKGYGYEAASAVVRWAFANLKLEAIEYPVDKRNRPSRRIAEKLGGVIVREGKTPQQNGGELDEVVYRICLETLRPPA